MTKDQFSRAGEILDGLREVELLVAELYKLFSLSFPLDRTFWQDLSREEENHAALVAELKETLLKNGHPFEVGKINLAILETYRQGLAGQVSRLKRGAIARGSAFFIARDLERTMVEHRFYDAVRSENGDYRAIQAKIQKETESHLQKLENYIKILFPSY